MTTGARHTHRMPFRINKQHLRAQSLSEDAVQQLVINDVLVLLVHDEEDVSIGVSRGLCRWKMTQQSHANGSQSIQS